MGALRYAAVDPIFFMHHANIDRIWSLYRRPQPDPDMPWGSNQYIWGKQSYTFVDIDGSSVAVTVSDIIKCMSNVTYLEPQSVAAPFMSLLSAPGAPQATPNERTVTLAQGGGTLTTAPLTVNANAQPEINSFLSQTPTNAPRPLSLLIVETGPIAYTDKFTVRVFVNKPDANRQTSIRDPHYVGRIRALDAESRVSEAGTDVTHTLSIMIPPGNSNFYNQVKPGSPFSVTFVPAGPGQNDESFRIQVKSIKLKVVGAQ